MAPKYNEKISSLSSIDDIEQHDELISEDWCDTPDEIDVMARQKKKQIFIDVTKALMVLGFSSWSNLVEGKVYNIHRQLVKLKSFMYEIFDTLIILNLHLLFVGVEQSNPKEMKTKLNGILEQRRKDRRDYLALINATEALNFGLHQKISTVNDFANNKSRIASTNNDNTKKQKRNDDHNAMTSNFIRAPNDNITSNNDNHNSPNNDRSKVLNRHKSPRRCKSTLSKKKIPKNNKKILEGTNSLPSSSSLQLSSIYIYNLNVLHQTSTNEDDEDNESDQDEEEKALTWACSVLIEEFNRKCSLRHQNKVINKRINQKLVAFHRFKNFQEEQRKEEAKKEAKGETMHKALESNKLQHDTNINIDNDANIDENNSISDENVAKSENENQTELENEDLDNHKIQIVSLQDQIRKEKGRSHISMVSGYFVSDKEKDKIKEAKQVLRRLDEEAERIKNKKRKEDEKRRLAQLRKILSLKAEELEKDFTNNNETSEANKEAGK